MNLGELIRWLEGKPHDATVTHGFGRPDSWRGPYSEIAFDPEPVTTVGAMLAHARSAVGRTFYVYNGGEFTINLDTKVNIAEYGCGGDTDDKITKWTLRYWELQF